MKKQAIIVLLLATFFVTSPAQADVTLNFESLPIETQVGIAFQGQGIIFDSPGFLVKDYTWGVMIIPSAPNYVHFSATTATIRFVNPLNPLTPATTSFFEFDNAGLYSSGGWFNGASIIARSFSGSIVDTAVINPVGPYTARAVFNTRLEGPGIHSIEFTSIVNNSGGGVMPFDNVRFADVSPVPVPGALLLFGTGIAGLAGTRLRRKKQL